ncbi:hypothetical protein ACEN2J_11125 [Pseudorhodobacter sp. W20_MBD10_FR17]|uniref:hypothetical protein n=1 Tax=Pseudorhodobacter sp. W20_MBD10_FR17 TaxID=3240266 RepID=UPI003F9678E4
MDWQKFQHFKAELAKEICCELTEVEAVFGPLTAYTLWGEEQAQSGQTGQAAIEANAYPSRSSPTVSPRVGRRNQN